MTMNANPIPADAPIRKVLRKTSCVGGSVVAVSCPSVVGGSVVEVSCPSSVGVFFVAKISEPVERRYELFTIKQLNSTVKP